jgi:DNA-binding NarL/FixJ family response regulator
MRCTRAASKLDLSAEISEDVVVMRVLMLDDHLMFLQGLKTLLETLAPELSVDISAGMNDGLQMAAASSYELILLDWYLGEGSAKTTGELNMQRLRDVGCTARIVVLSGQTDSSLIRLAIDAGAAGFIPKKYGTEIMLAALRVVVSGGIFLPPEAMYEKLAPHAASAAASESESESPSVTRTPQAQAQSQPQHARRATDALVDIEARFASLTARQAEVYRAVARGLPNKLIARELGITESTVKTHLSAVYAVLGVNNRTQAAFQASREGFRVG